MNWQLLLNLHSKSVTGYTYLMPLEVKSQEYLSNFFIIFILFLHMPDSKCKRIMF